MGGDSPIDALTPRVLLGGFVLIIVLAVGVTAFTSTVAFSPYNPSWDGTSTVRETIGADSTAPPVLTETAAYDRVDANGTLVIILAPDEPYTPSEIARLQGYLDRGGTILIAEDRRTDTNQLLDAFGTTSRIDGRPLRDPRQFHRSPALPVITNTSNATILENVDQLTLNGATVLNSTNGTAIAYTSSFAYLDTNSNDELDPDEQLQSYPVFASETVGEGRVLVLSDPSVFINQLADRNGNRAFLTQLQSTHDRVMLDVSHTSGTPLGALLWLWLRRTAWAQALVGGGGVGILWLYTDNRPRSRVRRIIDPILSRFERSPSVESLTLDPDDRSNFLHQQHPEWSRTRIERIADSMDHVTDAEEAPTDE